MRKGINLKERQRHNRCGKGCELYFDPRVELSSISPMEICFIFAMYVGLVTVKCYEECTY